MQTRRLRLGDVVDDYCPRERRLSNHVIVAMVDDAIKQTRCATCDFEHPYKDGKLPARRKKKDATAALYQQVLDGMTEKPPIAPPALIAVDEATTAEEPPLGAQLIARPSASAAAAVPAAVSSPGGSVPGGSVPGGSVPGGAIPGRPASTNLRSRARTRHAATATATAADVPAPPAGAPMSTPTSTVGSAHAEASLATSSAAASADQASVSEADAAPGQENEPLHRRTLIRATLPRPVGEVPTRQAPTFTIREAARAPKFRRPFARNARPLGGQAGQKNGVGGGPMGRSGPRGQQARGKKGGAAQSGVHHFGQGQGHGHGHGQGGHPGAHHAKGRQGNQGSKRFK